MIKKIKMEVEVEEVDSITCDKCKKEYFVEEQSSEVQEFQCIEFTGGYDSIYGDGTLVECEFCQHCFKKMIEKFMRTSEAW